MKSSLIAIRLERILGARLHTLRAFVEIHPAHRAQATRQPVMVHAVGVSPPRHDPPRERDCVFYLRPLPRTEKVPQSCPPEAGSYFRPRPGLGARFPFLRPGQEDGPSCCSSAASARAFPFVQGPPRRGGVLLRPRLLHDGDSAHAPSCLTRRRNSRAHELAIRIITPIYALRPYTPKEIFGTFFASQSKRT